MTVTRAPTGFDLREVMRLSPGAALDALRTSRDGLSDDEAEVRRRRYGSNELPKPPGTKLLRALGAELVQFFALMLWVASGLAFAVGMPQLGVAIVLVVVINALFSFYQEYRADRATKALTLLLPQKAMVIRSGQRATIPVEKLVPGDVLLLREGNRISCDARVVSADGLHVDNSILNGESKPVARVPEAPASDERMSAPDVVFAGTFVTSGFGLAAVVATGQGTQLAAISRLTGAVVRRPTPLRIDLRRTVRVIAVCAVGMGLAFFGLSFFIGGSIKTGLLFAVGVIVALVPNGLLPTVTTSLAISAKRMARRRALVRHLESVETLGSTTVICSDKTGTMTANQMTVQAVVVSGKRFAVSGVGFSTRGALLEEGRPLSQEELAPLGSLLKTAALCGNATVEQHEGRWRCLGDPIDGALLALATKGGCLLEAAERAEPRVHELAFDATRRRMSTVHRISSGHFEVLTKGSPESVLPLCIAVRAGVETVPFDELRRAEMLAAVESLAHEGLRVLALAHRLSAVPLTTVAAAETHLELLGLVGIADPVHPEVPGAVARCLSAGVRVLMLTGDHPATARIVADTVGLPPGDPVVGADLPADDESLQALMSGPVAVLARITPEQKLRVARALQALGEVVAMTGDGVNDAPALRQADIGVAMGLGGTDVAREAADIVLLDDNFAHIVDAVEEGRAVFDNIRRFLTYDLTVNVAELAPFLVWGLSVGRVPLVLSVFELLALDLGVSLLPALSLGGEPPEAETMVRPPRARADRSLDGRVLGRAFGFLGPLQAGLSLAFLPVGAALFFAWRPGSPLPAGAPVVSLISTLVFASIVLMQMVNAFECRSTPRSVFRLNFFANRLLPGSVAFALLLLMAFVYLPALRNLLGLTPLSAKQWLLVGVTPALFLGAEELRKAIARLHLRLRRRRSGQASSNPDHAQRGWSALRTATTRRAHGPG